jgi:erythromycin esterase
VSTVELRRRSLAIGTTSATGQILNPPGFYTGKLFTELDGTRPGSLDAHMAASHDGPFATDLRRLSPADAATVRTVSQQRYGAFCECPPLPHPVCSRSGNWLDPLLVL